jgi:hypothetical protein
MPPFVVTSLRRLDEEVRDLCRSYHRLVERTLHPEHERD